MTSTIYDIIIIGGGPIGLFTAVTAGEMGAACLIIESRLHLGGVMMAAYPDKEVYNFPGIAQIKGRDLIADLTDKAMSFGLVTSLGEYVRNIKSGNKGTVIVRSNKNDYVASTAIVTSGLKAYYSPFIELIKVKNWNGNNIYDKWPDADKIVGKIVTIIFGSSYNKEIPQKIRQAASKIYLIKDENMPDSMETELNDKHSEDAEVLRGSWTVKEINGLNEPEYIILENIKTAEIKEIKIDIVIGFFENQSSQTVFSNIGIEMVGQQIKVDQKMQTSIKRVFAAGDIAWYPGKIMLLSAGIYEARIAVKNALKMK